MFSRLQDSARILGLMMVSFLISSPAQAVFIGNSQGGTDFPQGAVSFADAVVNFSPAVPGPANQFLGSSNALGVPNYAGANGCASQAACTFVTLGDGGTITLRFTDNLLTGSGGDALDLWIFEVGPDVEDTFVEISKDGVLWSAVGTVSGSTAGVDIDAFGFGIADQFGYVRLRDDPNADAQGSGGSVGADIDAVGAISTIRTNTVPVPATWLLMLVGLVPLLRLRGRLA
jgi:hypothetical protein